MCFQGSLGEKRARVACEFRNIWKERASEPIYDTELGKSRSKLTAPAKAVQKSKHKKERAASEHFSLRHRGQSRLSVVISLSGRMRLLWLEDHLLSAVPSPHVLFFCVALTSPGARIVRSCSFL